MKCERQWHACLFLKEAVKSPLPPASSETEQATHSIQMAQVWDGTAATGLCPQGTVWHSPFTAHVSYVTGVRSSCRKPLRSGLVPAAERSNAAYLEWRNPLLGMPFLPLWIGRFLYMVSIIPGPTLTITFTDFSSPEIHFYNQ